MTVSFPLETELIVNNADGSIETFTLEPYEPLEVAQIFYDDESVAFYIQGLHFIYGVPKNFTICR